MILQKLEETRKIASKGDKEVKMHEDWYREEESVCSSDHFHHVFGVPKQNDWTHILIDLQRQQEGF